MAELKPLSKKAIPHAQERAERYRLLNEPLHAESIYRDILSADPGNHAATIGLVLSLTDQFRDGTGHGIEHAREQVRNLPNEYEQAYYSGIISERWGSAQLAKGVPGYAAVDWFREAMRSYEKAETLSPPDNAEAILRWNACARIIERTGAVQPRPAALGFESPTKGEMPLE